MKGKTSSENHTILIIRVFTLMVVTVFFIRPLAAADFRISGRITDPFGNAIQNAKVSFISGNTHYTGISEFDGTYSLKVFGIYEDVPGLIELGSPYPNPFTYSINIPFIISSDGEIRFSVYSFTGQKITEKSFPGTVAGSYQLIWDGRTDNGAPVRQGYYIYSITFRGKTSSGKLVKVEGRSTYSAGTGLEPIMMPPVIGSQPGSGRIPVITTVECDNYYPVRLTDISLARDTVIDFELAAKQDLPYKISGDHIAMYTGTAYRPLILKGINLGSSPPGYFPGEIAYAVEDKSAGTYEKWIRQMSDAGFNSIRVYTLHPPVFYEKLAEHNQRNPDKPLLLFQGIWLDEIEDNYNPDDYDLIIRSESFKNSIKEVIDCIHGNNDIAFRAGRAYGRYLTNVSRWTAGYIIGREIMPQEIDSTNLFHKEMTSFSGFQFSISEASASEVFITKMLDEVVSYEAGNYEIRRPVSASSWPTLDPLHHPTEIYTDEDIASFDIYKIVGKDQDAGIFACYHAYPYYPNFISQQPSYQIYEDEKGKNSYLGYLTDLKDHYSGIPLVIGEFGVPSSWTSAHQSYSDMNHGGYSEEQQGEKNMRMMNNILTAGCAGGFMFSWMDEWFKPTWLVAYLEAYGFYSGGVLIPTRQLWHNLASPEQNFGLLTFEQTLKDPFIEYQTDKPSGPLAKIEATHDNSYLMLQIETRQVINQGDTMIIAFDTYLGNTGESKLPNGKTLINKSEFMLPIVFGQDTAVHHVTQAYDMNGLTPRFNLSDPLVQKYRTTNTDGDPWKPMMLYNDGFEYTLDSCGKLPMENSADFTPGQRSAIAWSGNRIKIRIPWTMLYFYDPSQLQVVNGAVSYDGGRSYQISTATTDGVAVSVYYQNSVTSSTTRYIWENWLIVPPNTAVEKKSYQIVRSGLSVLPMFAD